MNRIEPPSWLNCYIDLDLQLFIRTRHEIQKIRFKENASVTYWTLFFVNEIRTDINIKIDTFHSLPINSYLLMNSLWILNSKQEGALGTNWIPSMGFRSLKLGWGKIKSKKKIGTTIWSGRFGFVSRLFCFT